MMMMSVRAASGECGSCVAWEIEGGRVECGKTTTCYRRMGSLWPSWPAHTHRGAKQHCRHAERTQKHHLITTLARLMLCLTMLQPSPHTQPKQHLHLIPFSRQVSTQLQARHPSPLSLFTCGGPAKLQGNANIMTLLTTTSLLLLFVVVVPVHAFLLLPAQSSSSSSSSSMTSSSSSSSGLAAVASPSTTTTTNRLSTTLPRSASASDDENDFDDRPPRVLPPKPEPTPIQYNSPLFPPKVLDSLWNEQRKPLLRLGMKGVMPSHLNSLRELLDAHNVVRIKVNGPASDNLQAMAERALKAGTLPNASQPMGVLLRVKGKEFLVGRTDKMEALRKRMLLPEVALPGGGGGQE